MPLCFTDSWLSPGEIFSVDTLYILCTQSYIRMGSKNGKPVLHNEDIAQLSQSSGLDADDVREAFAGFVAKHPDGKMKAGDFREIMTTALPKKDVRKTCV